MTLMAIDRTSSNGACHYATVSLDFDEIVLLRNAVYNASLTDNAGRYGKIHQELRVLDEVACHGNLVNAAYVHDREKEEEE